MLATVPRIAHAEPATLPDKPFAEHRIVLQLSDNDPKKQSLVISVAYNLLKLYDPDKAAIEVVTFGPGIDLLFPGNANRSSSRAWSRRAYGSTSASIRWTRSNAKPAGDHPLFRPRHRFRSGSDKSWR